MKIKRILAIIGVILLVGLYVATLLLAVFDSSATMSMFRAAVGCTILLPVMLYAYTMVYKWLKDRNNDLK